jgi:RNA polymerase sigma-70 factor (ECF subfamily)
MHTTEHNPTAAHPKLHKAVRQQGGDMAAGKDASLAHRLRVGERAAAEELVDNYYERIYLFMRAVGHDRQISEDLTQETFVRVWNHIGQLRDGRALTGWLFRIAGNVSRLHWRRHGRKDEKFLPSVETAGQGQDAAELAAERERFRRLHRAVAELPWKLRQAIVLHYLGQLTIAEAAEAAGVREGTLKSRLNRGLMALRRNLDIR